MQNQLPHLISQKMSWRSHIQTLVVWLFWVEESIVGKLVLSVMGSPLHPYCFSKTWKSTAKKCQRDDCQGLVGAGY